MTYGSLFSGIGGMDLGLDRAGMTCRWQVEIDPYASRVLAKHWPDVRRWGNIKTFIPDTASERFGTWGPGRIAARRERREQSTWAAQWHVDLIAGGFPCQDISYAGKGAGLSGKRSGLWYEFARVARILRPRYVLVENVSALLVRGIDAVLGTLASLGYDCEWSCIPAAAVGAPHIRDRVFIVAYAASGREATTQQQGRVRGIVSGGQDIPHANGQRQPQPGGIFTECRGRLIDFRETVGRDQWGNDPADLPDADSEQENGTTEPRRKCGNGFPQSRVGRMVARVPNRMDRLRGLGNSVVPQVAEFIGRQIIAFHQQHEVTDGTQGGSDEHHTSGG